MHANPAVQAQNTKPAARVRPEFRVGLQQNGIQNSAVMDYASFNTWPMTERCFDAPVS